MKKVLALILSLTLIVSALVLPGATIVSAAAESEFAFSDAITVLSNDISPRAIRTKVLSDGTVAAVYYRSGSGIFYATSSNGGVTFSEGVKIIGNAKDSELAESEEVTTQTTLAKEYVAKYGPYGRGRLEAQNPNLVELKNGDVAAFYRYNTFETDPENKPWGIYYASICYQILDKETGVWGDVQVMYECTEENVVADSGSPYGVWEPDPVYIGDELFCYFADTDLPRNTNYQHIMYCVYDEESGKFSAPEIAQNGIEHKSRDGMSVVTKLTDGTYAMVFESTRTAKSDYEDIHNYTTFVIKMSFSNDGRNWSEPVIVAKPNAVTAPATGSNEYAVCAAPYVVTLPDGRLAVSYQTTDRYTGRIPNRVSYRIGTQVAVSSQPITSATFADKTENADVTSYFATELNPGVLGENEFSKSAELMVNNNKLYVYYSVGNNSWPITNGVETEKHDFGDIRMAYINLPEVSLDGSDINNYIVYNNSGKTVTESNGAFVLPNGCTNMVYGEADKVEVFEKGAAVEGLYDIANYTTYTNSTLANRFVIDGESFKVDSQTRNWLAGTENMTNFEASATIQGNSKGVIYAGFGFHMQADAFDTSTFKFSTSGYTVIPKRTAGSTTLEILVRYISGTTVYDETVNKITVADFFSTATDEKVNIKVWADNDNFYVVATNPATDKTTEVYTYPLDYTSTSGKHINWTSGGFMLTANGVNTFTDFELYNASVATVDSSKMVNATDLDATATINYPATLSNDNQVGMSFRVQSAVDKPAPGVSGYVVKLLQYANFEDKMKIQLTRYGTKADGTTNANLGDMYTENTAIDGNLSGKSVIVDAKLRDDILIITLTDAADASVTSTHTFNLKKASGSYSDYYEYGGFGFFKNGNATDITVSDVSFTKLAKNVNKIADDSAYTVYRPESSEEVTYEDNAFVNNDSTTKKIMLNDTLVSNFKADATLEVGIDGNLKGGIIFRAQNVGRETNDMDGYSVVVYKTPNTTTNYGRMVLLVYKWARLANGKMDYMGTVGSKVFLDTFNSVYPEAESDLLAAAGAKVKLNVEVKGDTVTANFDVLNKDNIVAASTDDVVVKLDNTLTGVDKNKVFADDAASVMYNAGEIGLSISTLGKICDFNLIEAEDEIETSDIDGYDFYSSNDKTLVRDTVNNKIYSTTAGQKQAVLSDVEISNFKASARMKSTSAGATYNMGFDFMINEATHSGAAYNTNHATMGYEGYRLVLVRNANSSTNPAGTTLYLFKFTKGDTGYTRTQVKTASNSNFFADYTAYGEIEVDFAAELVDGKLTATATVCEHTDKKITLTYDGLTGTGSTGWFISGGGSLTGLSVKTPLKDSLVTATDCTNGSVYAGINSGAAKVGDDVKVIGVGDKGYRIDEAFVNGKAIAEGENGYVFKKECGAAEISATFFLVGDLDKDGKAASATDISNLRNDLLGKADIADKYADINDDNKVNLKDLVNIKKISAGIEN